MCVCHAPDPEAVPTRLWDTHSSPKGGGAGTVTDGSAGQDVPRDTRVLCSETQPPVSGSSSPPEGGGRRGARGRGIGWSSVIWFGGWGVGWPGSAGSGSSRIEPWERGVRLGGGFQRVLR